MNDPKYFTVSRAVRRMRRMLPWAVFSGGFILTTVIGAVITGCSHGDRWGIDENRHLALLLNMNPLSTGLFERPDYWWVLAIAAGVPLVGAMVTALATPLRLVSVVSPSTTHSWDLIAARIVFFGGLLWLAARILTAIPGGYPTIHYAWSTSFEEHYQIRRIVVGLLHHHELGFAYSGLPCLLAIPLHRALISKRTFWSWLELGIWYAAYGMVAAILVQKLLISLGVLVSLFGIVTSGNLFKHYFRLLLAGALIFGIVHFSMSNFQSDWKLSSSIDHLIGRTADSYPYVMTMAPRHQFSIGQYLVGSISGSPAFLGQTATYNIDAYELMYPETSGAVAIAAPVWSYCDVGWGGLILTTLIVAAFCTTATWLSSHVDRSIWAWSIFLLLSLQIYHLTQMPVIGVLFWSYAITYGLVSLFLVALVAHLTRHFFSRYFHDVIAAPTARTTIQT